MKEASLGRLHPFVIGVVHDHELILFNLPRGEAAELEVSWKFRLTINPKHAAVNQPGEDVSMELVKCLEECGLVAMITPNSSE